jgi:uncharacterized Zn finger protein
MSATASLHAGPALLERWASLSWEDIGQWTDSRSVQRGRTYQRRGAVHNVALDAQGRLLAGVFGSEPYALRVALERGGTDGARSVRLQSICSCPVRRACKHAVAAVVQLLAMMAKQTALPLVSADDPRPTVLDLLEHAEQAEDRGRSPQEMAPAEFQLNELDSDDGQEDPLPAGTRAPSASRAQRSRAGRDKAIRKYLTSLSHEELVALLLELLDASPELRVDLERRVAAAGGDVDSLVQRARRELNAVTAEPAWRNRWSGEEELPDYTSLRRSLETLLSLRRHDEVVVLGRELITLGLAQVGQSDDDGHVAMELAECLIVVFDALAKSSMPGPQRILFAIDAALDDDYGVCDESANAFLRRRHSRADWSVVADRLAARLRDHPGSSSPSGEESSSGRWRRRQLGEMLIRALTAAGRVAEVEAVYERNAREVDEYEPLVRRLLEQQRIEDATRWAVEGIARTNGRAQGVTSSLRGILCDLAASRGAFEVVAAHKAREFFARPGVEAFEELMRAATQAGCVAAVRAGAMAFLETGRPPIRWHTDGSGAWTAHVDRTWPLPVLEELAPPAPQAASDLSTPRGRRGSARATLTRSTVATAPTPPPTANYGVLIGLAIAANRPDEVLRWYDAMHKANRADQVFSRWSGSAVDPLRVAGAVANSHPARALEIYQARLDDQLTRPDRTAYEQCGNLLRMMRPVLVALGREPDWFRLLASLRSDYRNRPRFMDVLDGVEGRPILAPARRSR